MRPEPDPWAKSTIPLAPSGMPRFPSSSTALTGTRTSRSSIGHALPSGPVAPLSSCSPWRGRVVRGPHHRAPGRSLRTRSRWPQGRKAPPGRPARRPRSAGSSPSGRRTRARRERGGAGFLPADRLDRRPGRHAGSEAVVHQYRGTPSDLGFGPIAAQERQAPPYLLSLLLGDPLDVPFGNTQLPDGILARDAHPALRDGTDPELLAPQRAELARDEDVQRGS